MNLAAYCRISALGHGVEPIEIQKEKISKFATAYNHKIAKWFIDEGVSAFKDRPAFNKMMADIGNYDGVISTALDRFGRSAVDLLLNINKLKEMGKHFITVDQRIDTSTKEGQLLLTVLSAVAEFEHRSISERLKAGREYADKHGSKSGKPCHRPEKEINWQEYEKLKKMNAPMSLIARELKISRATLYKKVEEKKEEKPT